MLWERLFLQLQGFGTYLVGSCCIVSENIDTPPTQGFWVLVPDKNALSDFWQTARFSVQIALHSLVQCRKNLTLHQKSLRALFPASLQLYRCYDLSKVCLNFSPLVPFISIISCVCSFPLIGLGCSLFKVCGFKQSHTTVSCFVEKCLI